MIRFFETGVGRLKELPGIEEAAVGASLPAERALNMPATFPDSNQPELTRAVNWRYVTPGYFSLLKIRYLAGRAINEADRVGAAPIAVVNETFARENYGGMQQALGRRIAVAKEPAREIVGVVADTSGWALGEPPRAMMFVPLAQVEPSIARLAHSFFPPRWIVRSSLDAAGARRHLESVIRELDPTQPFIDVRSLESLMLGSIAMQRFYLVVLTTFAAFAVLLAAVGVYAAYSYAVASRTTEIGVRLALGAKPGQILWSVVSRALMLGGIATAIGLGVAAGASRLLRSVLFGISASDPSTYVIVGVGLVLTVLMAALLPAIRAAKVDPLAAIRR